MAEPEKRMAGNYEITQALRIGDRDVVFGIDPASDQPYFCALYHKVFEIIQFREWYEECFASDNFVKVAEQFAKYVQKQCQMVREEWAKVTVPRIRITEEMCMPHDYGQDIDGKIVAIKPSALRPEYRSADHQLVLVDGGSAPGKQLMSLQLTSGSGGLTHSEAALRLNQEEENLTLLSYSYSITGISKPADTEIC